uniref:Putative proteasome activator protein pa26 n=1 Tax=Trypanosoma congolense (strain IL3000) TaxID=1068625 RepID=G0UVX8_TRYCI|nr:putative proteasome activator protein pa26 [Trypanosoma congolense IL3000]
MATRGKRFAHVQTMRDAMTEQTSWSVIDTWANNTIEALQKISASAAQARSSIQGTSYRLSHAEETPVSTVDLLRQYQTLCHDIYCDAQLVRSVIMIRIPDHKEEDNLGVAVQMEVLKLIEGLEGKLLPSGEKSSSVGGVFCLRDYLATRATVEEKLLGSSNAGSEGKKGSKAPSLLLELREIDMDALLKVEFAATHLCAVLRGLVTSYTLNWKKLMQPRTGNDYMIS